ncbi:G-type lectin S-receptor-like serine/threonine-protein kinase At4g03230 [Corylus avellana]|uniref:G-type lectin S-receptor-like serine/threonine-protein kinase At4g03230 n=1 Tax=Corylus avellana TaxID=13451 RepID=UPI00286D5AA7|nr:G-type lectin S-receptor-like serine/threonine-protein kinase At4g03230 [Corylus avellana]
MKSSSYCSGNQMMVTVNDMLIKILCLFLFCFPFLCSARDTITWNSSISDFQGETLVSAGGRFVLGFFTPNGSLYMRRYVGIWYLNSTTFVWVANRDKPLGNFNGVFAIAGDGNAKVLDRNNKSYWSTGRLRNSSYTHRILKLQDSGNLVLTEEGPSNNTVIWQSFDDPTDTFLPGMKMDTNMVLTSWKSSDDPGLGHFTFQQDQDEPNQYIIRREGSILYWASTVSGDFIDSNTHDILAAIFSEVFTYEYRDMRLVMDHLGKIQYFIRVNVKTESWILSWFEPRHRCSVYNACGNFGSCNSRTRKLCKCLPGFEPKSSNKWNSGDFSDGCKRVSISPICGENGRRDRFLSLKMMKVGKAKDLFHVRNETDCANDCLRDCSCQAYSYDENVLQRSDKQGKCRIWGDLDNLSENYTGGRDLFLRVAASGIVSVSPGPDEGTSEKKKKNKPSYLIFLGTIATIIVILCIICSVFFLKRRRMANRQDNRGSNQGRIALQLYDTERHIKDFIDSVEFREEDKKGIDVPFFDLASILAATDNFSEANKLGQGGFGPVYKGKFPGGQLIAIKRLSRGSRQGLEEFKNEVLLIAKLQHRNLVRLLGYCIDRDEKMLLYEYMPNKSLDSFLFDRTLCVLLNWEIRLKIILETARGLLYLHQDSRLRIIHRDLKTSNVLLDEEMNPKISDFGLARIFGGKQTEGSTTRVVGTYGYMSPEYALDGFFSVKSDAFSFGVVVLEVISGKRNTGFFHSEQALISLLGYTWKLWKEDKALDLMDQTLGESCNTNEFLRCVNVGLLCVQEDPSDRPTMSNAVFMLGSETATLPTPKQPAFVVRRSLSSSKPESLNELTASIEEGR